MPSISTVIIVFCGFGMLACLLGLGWACNALAVERDRFAALFATADQKEGMQAFIQKRPPAWKGA